MNVCESSLTQHNHGAKGRATVPPVVLRTVMLTRHTMNALQFYLEEDADDEMESLKVESQSRGRGTGQAAPTRLYRIVGMALAVMLVVIFPRLSKTVIFPEDSNKTIASKPSVKDAGALTNLSNVDGSNATPPLYAGDETSDPPPEPDDTTKLKGMVKMKDKGVVYEVTRQAAQQIKSYRQGTGLIVNIHITHHGGTTVCSLLGRSRDAVGASPTFNCLHVKPEDNVTDTNYPRAIQPWTLEDTATNIAIVRKYFHMISWEFGNLYRIPNPSLEVTEWENHNLLSVFVVRDPMSRLLAGSGYLNKHYPGVSSGNAKKDEWWRYARDPWFTNNYALRVLAGNECCNGTNTDPRHLENAKAVVEQFSIVLDIECLIEGLKALAGLLNITLATSSRSTMMPPHHVPPRERIGYDDVYEFLLEKNHLDIELYEWSRSRALVDCSKIQQ